MKCPDKAQDVEDIEDIPFESDPIIESESVPGIGMDIEEDELDNRPEEAVHAYQGRDIGDYCQPTSSKVLIKDLVTSAKDEKHHQDCYTNLDADMTESSAYKARFWDQPVAPPSMEWVVLLMMPTFTAESVRPYKFTRLWYPDRDKWLQLMQNMRIHANDDSDDTMERLAKMKEHNERRNTHPVMIPEPEPPPKKWASKEWATYIMDDVPELRQQWYEQYEDLLHGVPEEMLPFWEVNHEIPLIDPSQRYRYHLLWCPNTLKAEFNEKVEKYM
ncbi:hypothetical protein ARMGADRAFT_1027055 [Armillaria gallica]|uniref:Uncharacterized protein n=1 Tax=Armillaria gallica TaxID=47427 RepID=A0A2H3EAF5_ARMGA|nr:hypothetical protein ARMGADRAFT_1027055 [Armillaria gallica]